MDPQARMDRRAFLRSLGKKALRISIAIPAGAGLANLVLNSTAVQAESPTEEIDPEFFAPLPLVSTFMAYHEMSAARLTNDLMSMINSGYQPISLETLISYFYGMQAIPPGVGTFLVTCDDGLLSQYVAALDAVDYVMDRTGWFVPMTFFAIAKFNDYPEPIEQIPGNTPCYRDGKHSYMSRDQLVDLIQRGHRVESHTVNHCNLPLLSLGARNAEIVVAEARINSLWDLAGVTRQYKAFAYPYGNYSGQTAYLQTQGYDVAFSMINTKVHDVSTRLFTGRTRMT